MFRYNNPDALLVLLLVVAAYCMVRAIETGRTRWVGLVGVRPRLRVPDQDAAGVPRHARTGAGLPGRRAVGLWQRIGKLLVGAVAMLVTAGSFLALVSLWPADSRPYIAGSTDNSLLQLAVGYNGIQRIAGGEARPRCRRTRRRWRTGAAGNLFFGGDPGLGRLFGASMGTEASWLLPAALIGLVAGLWFTRRTARTAGVRASLLLWGGWLLVTGAVFSFMDGTIHPYYTVALAPRSRRWSGSRWPSSGGAGSTGSRGRSWRRCWR